LISRKDSAREKRPRKKSTLAHGDQGVRKTTTNQKA
jgi:hypothetical protein